MMVKVLMSKRIFDMKILFALTGLLLAFGAHADPMPGTSNLAIVKSTDEQQSASGMAEAGGRVLVLFTHPILPQKLWAGTEHGGLWQSTDSGNSWAPASVLMTKLTVSSLAVDPGNPDIIYAGTGEGRSNDVALRGPRSATSLLRPSPVPA